VSSGAINTEMISKPFNSPMGEFSLTKDLIPTILKRDLAEPWEIAASIAFLLGDESRYVTKSSWYHDGGWVEGNFT
jgi:NAD(P)-dependent dehydrogenase (short-subunit alcohol dehydrogenase family)